MKMPNLSIHDKILDAFIKGSTDKRLGKYLIKGNALFYAIAIEYREDISTPERLNALIDKVKAGHITLVSDIDLAKRSEANANVFCTCTKLQWERLAQRLPCGLIVGNASRLLLAPGRRHNAKFIQQVMETRKLPMLPFNVFEEASIPLKALTILNKNEAETITRKIHVGIDKHGKPKTKLIKTHFTGASLFKLEDAYFLFDIDRQEIEHGIFNAFLVQLAIPVTTIEEAYASLVPTEVKEAKNKGLDVKRQGEWFLIPAMREAPPEASLIGSLNNSPNMLGRRTTVKLQVGDNRANHADMGFQDASGSYYITGMLQHSGREHAPLDLSGYFYKAIPNTAAKSFTITGDVD